MTCGSESPAWIFPVFILSAGAAVFLTLDVMCKTEHDEINRRAPLWLQWARRFGFALMATALCTAIAEAASQISMLLLYASGVYSLAVNDIALRLRRPPKGGKMRATNAYRITTSAGGVTPLAHGAKFRSGDR